MVEDQSVEALTCWQSLDLIIASVTFYLSFACMVAAAATDSLVLALLELLVTACSLPVGCLAWVRFRAATTLKKAEEANLN